MNDNTSNFEAFMAAERERLNNERARLWDQQAELEQKLAAIDNELKAINAYVAVKEGKPLPAALQEETKKPRDPNVPKRTRAPRSEGTGLKQRVLELIRQSGDGITSGNIYPALQMDDKAGRQAVNNALMALKKDGAIQQAGRRQPYTATEHPGADEQEAA